MKTLFALLACACCAAAQAAPPPAPVITVAATDVRQLEFNWAPVSGVQTYELWFRSAVGAPWVKAGGRDARSAPLFRIRVPVHLLNWSTANYLVKACNYGGCSSSNIVGVNDQRFAAIGFFKPRETTGVVNFGNNVALSADGNTMAVSARETVDKVRDTVIVHVYRRITSSHGWRLEARLRPSIMQPYIGRYLGGKNLVLSGDGNVLVLGYDTFGGCTDTSYQHVGSVDVFRRSGTAWTHFQYLRGCEDGENFGSAIDMDHGAQTLVIHHLPPGADTGRGTLKIYRAKPGEQFAYQMSLPPPPEAGPSARCENFAVSNYGNRLVRGCSGDTGDFSYVYTGWEFAQTAVIDTPDNLAYDMNDEGTVFLVQDLQGARAYRLGASDWELEGVLDDGPGTPDNVRGSIAISGDGKIAAIGNYNERTLGRGPLSPPFRMGSEENATGGVMVYLRNASGWQLRRLVKPGSYNVGYAGMSVALSDNGQLLAVAAPIDPSAAAGIDGNRGDASAPDRGAVWLY